ncbi:MAG: F0F1 ATP synthase subunit A [Bryobacteraceae bacterium]
MTEHELWLTALFNHFLPGIALWIENAVGIHVEDAAHPWANWAVMELLVFAIILVLFPFLRSRLSVDRPGKLQQTFELVYEFLHSQTEEAGVHHVTRYLPFFGAIFIFVLFANLLGVIPTFEAPTMSPVVPCGCALAAFGFYHLAGIREHGVWRYLAHFAGPFPALAPLMIPIEFISHLARPLSLTIRLFANMYAGEQITLAFIGLTYLVFPAVFMGLHIFVSLLQAYIFALLAMIYVGGAAAHEH